MNAFRVASLVIPMFALGACTYNSDTQRVGFNYTSESREQQLGEEAMAKLRSLNLPLSKDRAAVERLQRIGARLAKAGGADPAKVQFFLVEQRGLNAFTLPGRKIIVLSGVLTVSKNDDVVASILGHEVAHMVLRHGAEDASNEEFSQDVTMAILSPLTVFMSKEQKAQAEQSARNGAGFSKKIFRPLEAQRSRSQEYEADALGLRIMAKAGYAPEAALVLWAMMAKAEKQGLAGRYNYLSTHPASIDRLRMLVKAFPTAKKLQAGDTQAVRTL